MPIVSTDDAARNLEFRWMGFPGFKLPAAPFAAYGTFAGIAATGIVVGWLARPNAGVWLFIMCPIAIVVALIITKIVFRHVDSQNNLRYWQETLKAELRAPRPPRDGAGLNSETRVAPALFTNTERTRP